MHLVHLLLSMFIQLGRTSSQRTTERDNHRYGGALVKTIQPVDHQGEG